MKNLMPVGVSDFDNNDYDELDGVKGGSKYQREYEQLNPAIPQERVNAFNRVCVI